jgi:hypothetical protein
VKNTFEKIVRKIYFSKSWIYTENMSIRISKVKYSRGGYLRKRTVYKDHPNTRNI